MNNTWVGEFFRKKSVWVVLLLDIVIVVALIVAYFLKADRTAILTFNIVPADSVISINGREYQNGTYAMTPGHYEVELSHENLESKTLNLNLESDHNITVATFLKGQDNDLSYYKSRYNLTDFLNLEQIASKENNLTYDNDTSAEAFISRFGKAYDLYNSVLPIEHQESKITEDGPELTLDITIKQDNDTECQTFLCIKALMVFTDDKGLIKTLMKEKGMELEDYEVYYKIF